MAGIIMQGSRNKQQNLLQYQHYTVTCVGCY